jgi:hypothetical protein
MARSCSKVRLENGLKLDLNNLARRGFVRRGAVTGPVGITWTHSYWGEIAAGKIWASMDDPSYGRFEIEIGGARQFISLAAQPRRFGGRQWYFVRPATRRLASVLWRPPGATRFCSRLTWGRQVAYFSQCVSSVDRAWHGKSKIKRRLIGKLDPDEWDLPPKPKWMRWHTYQRYIDRFDRYEELLDRELCFAAARVVGSKFPV